MAESAEAARLLLGSLALMALLATAYGILARAPLPLRPRPWALGALFGAAAMLAMLDPVRVAPGVIVDLRGVPLALAGAFLGLRGALVALALALALRLGLGGPGVAAGVLAMVLSVGAGLLWARLAPATGRRGPRALGGLAALSALHLGATALLPAPQAWEVVATIWPVLLPLHLLGVLVVGALLERERAMIEAERGLARSAGLDALTGLLNRRGFEAEVARVRPEFTGAALLLLDLDHFKRVNDEHGHAGGDAVLRQAGQRLLQALGGRGVVGRLGGEEFAVYLPSALPREAAGAADRLCALLRREAFALPDGGRVLLTASVGAACAEGPAGLAALLSAADAALYVAKRAGRDRYVLGAEPPALAPKAEPSRRPGGRLAA